MPLGTDKQYDLSWEEQDKIRRRLELKDRLKLDGIKRKYDPFLTMKNHVYTDPALLRYNDLRKKGRMPGAPFKPQIFFGMIGFIFIPMFVLYQLAEWDRKPYLERCASGDMPYSERRGKSVL